MLNQYRVRGIFTPIFSLPTSGRLELVRALINFAYRKSIAEAASMDALPAFSGQR